MANKDVYIVLEWTGYRPQGTDPSHDRPPVKTRTKMESRIFYAEWGTVPVFDAALSSNL